MHRVKIKLQPTISPNGIFEYIELEQDHDQTYRWNTYNHFNQEQTGQYQEPLKDIEKKYKNGTNKFAWIEQERQSIYIHVGDKHQQPTILEIGYITIHPSKNNSHQPSIILCISNHHNSTPYYDLSAIHGMPPQRVAEYILFHIPIDDIIQRFIHKFPHQCPHNTNILHHYHPRLPSSIPCASSKVTNISGGGLWGGPEERTLNIRAPSYNDQYIRIGTCIHQSMINDHDPCIHPTDSLHSIIPKLAQHIYKSYIQHPNITTLSAHEQAHIHRVFRDHRFGIAQQVYHDALQHRAARLQSPIFTFPRIEL